MPKGTPVADNMATLTLKFAGWHSLNAELLTSTDAASVLRHDIYDLAHPLHSYVHSCTLLLGVAAHPERCAPLENCWARGSVALDTRSSVSKYRHAPHAFCCSDARGSRHATLGTPSRPLDASARLSWASPLVAALLRTVWGITGLSGT